MSRFENEGDSQVRYGLGEINRKLLDILKKIIRKKRANSNTKKKKKKKKGNHL